MSEKVVRVHEALARHGVPHAFGGAIAVDYYRVPRATIDIDLNVFVAPEESAKVIAALDEQFPVVDPDALAREISTSGQGKTYWGDTRIDLFFAAFEYHDSLAERVRAVAYEGVSIPILSAEDILLIKAIFDRTQDWADIEAVCKLIGGDLDRDYLTHWIDRIIGLNDPRAQRLVAQVEQNR